MIIGKYIIKDWEHMPPYWYKKIYLCSTGESLGSINVYLSVTQFPGKFAVNSYLLGNEFGKLYGHKMPFDSLKQAKQTVDLFLDKLQKLKAFL